MSQIRPTLPASSGPPANSGTFSLQAQTVGEIGILTSLQPDVERARNEHALRHPEAVSAVLGRVIAEANSCAQSTLLDAGTRACFELLIASAQCLLGRSALGRNAEVEAAGLFAEALKLFERNMGEIGKQRNASQLWTDYGIALYNTGGAARATEVLLNAEATGAALAETFNYLALAYKQSANGNPEILKKAAEAASRGLLVASGDPGLYVTRAEVLTELHDVGGAVAMYLEAALGASRSNDLNASDLVSRALQLDPGNQQAVSLAVEIRRAQGDFEGALELVAPGAAAVAGEPWAKALRGRLLREMGRRDEAIQVLREVPIDGDTAWVAAELGSALIEIGDITGAAQALERALAYRPQDAAARAVMGQLFIAQGRTADAIVELQTALQLDPSLSIARYELGRAYYEGARFAEAVRMFDQVLQTAPGWSDAAAAKAAALFGAEEYSAAFTQARKALKLNPGDEQMLQLIRESASLLDRDDDAVLEMEIEIARNPQSAQAFYLKGSILLDRNDLDGAVESLAQAVELNPGDADMRITYSNALRLSGVYEQAGEECKRALKSGSPSPAARGWAAIFFGETGDFTRACEVLSEATSDIASPGWVWGALGWALQYRDLSSARESLKAYTRAVEMDKPGRSIWNVKGVADAHALCGERAVADEQFRAILKEWPDISDPDTLYVHGWSYYRVGEYERAAELLGRAADTSANFIFARFDQGLAMLAGGREGHARSYYARAIAEAERVHPLRLRGVLYVAAFDIAEAAKNGRLREGNADLTKPLVRRMERLWPNHPGMPWLTNSGDSGAKVK